MYDDFKAKQIEFTANPSVVRVRDELVVTVVIRLIQTKTFASAVHGP